jgi:hypothetical protein
MRLTTDYARQLMEKNDVKLHRAGEWLDADRSCCPNGLLLVGKVGFDEARQVLHTSIIAAKITSLVTGECHSAELVTYEISKQTGLSEDYLLGLDQGFEGEDVSCARDFADTDSEDYKVGFADGQALIALAV